MCHGLRLVTLKPKPSTEALSGNLNRPRVRSLEANWLIDRFNNLKITDELLDPDCAVSNGQETRWSLDYELAPIQFA